MNRDEILSQIKSILHGVFAERLRGVVLFGSEARGTAAPDSDIDLLVLLDAPVDYGGDLKTGLDALYPLALEIGRRISAKPVEAEEYDTVECPLYQNAHREGIVV